MNEHDDTIQSPGASLEPSGVTGPTCPLHRDEPWASGQRRRYLASLGPSRPSV